MIYDNRGLLNGCSQTMVRKQPTELAPWEEIVGVIEAVIDDGSYKIVKVNDQEVRICSDIDISSRIGTQVEILNTGQDHRIITQNDE